jgi:hypothetical protein
MPSTLIQIRRGGGVEPAFRRCPLPHAQGRLGLPESIGAAAHIMHQFHERLVTQRDAMLIGQQVRQLREVRQGRQLADPLGQRPGV